MNKYAKFIDGYPSFAPNPILYNDTVIYNASDSIYIELGFMPVVYADMPECDENHYPVEHWSMIDNQIEQWWTIEEITDASEQDFLNALSDVGVTVDD